MRVPCAVATTSALQGILDRPARRRRPRDGAQVGQPAEALGVVESIAHYEPSVRQRLIEREGGPVEGHVDLALRGLVHQGADAQAPRLMLANVVEQEVERDT